MSDNKKYYYMRVKENFFESNELTILESMQDGYLYSNILLKLYLRSLKDNGKLMFNDRIPYSPQMIATITRHQVGTVEKALRIFQEMGLIEVLDNGAIYMLDIQQFIGKTSTEADRKRAYRKEIESQKKGQMSGQISDKGLPKIEIDIEKELEIEKEKEKDKEICNVSSNDDTLQPPVITLTLNTKEEYPIYQSDIEDWKDIYPNVDVLQELRKMKGWLNANPTRRKTKKGIARFINNWLSKEQDKPHYNQPSLHNVDVEEEKEENEESKKTMMSDEELKLLLDQVKDGVF